MEKDEATKVVPDLESTLVQYVRTKLKEKIKLGAKPFATYRGASIYKFGDDETGYIVLVHSNEVVYFVRHRRIRYGGFRLGRQVLLWRDKRNDPVTGGFAQTVFFNILLPRYGALIADKEQTRNGAAFWSNAIISAFTRGLHVYCLDRRGKVTLTELKNESDVEGFAPVLWGTTKAHLLTFGVISNKPLFLRKKSDK
jgi:hypothetical protein